MAIWANVRAHLEFYVQEHVETGHLYGELFGGEAEAFLFGECSPRVAKSRLAKILKSQGVERNEREGIVNGLIRAGWLEPHMTPNGLYVGPTHKGAMAYISDDLSMEQERRVFADDRQRA